LYIAIATGLGIVILFRSFKVGPPRLDLFIDLCSWLIFLTCADGLWHNHFDYPVHCSPCSNLHDQDTQHHHHRIVQVLWVCPDFWREPGLHQDCLPARTPSMSPARCHSVSPARCRRLRDAQLHAALGAGQLCTSRVRAWRECCLVMPWWALTVSCSAGAFQDHHMMCWRSWSQGQQDTRACTVLQPGTCCG
jgi:hypothetical protein